MNSATNLTHWKGIPLKDMDSHQLIEALQKLWTDCQKIIDINNDLMTRLSDCSR